LHIELSWQSREERPKRRRETYVRHYSIAATSTEEIAGR
jgi:hypothetical protein